MGDAVKLMTMSNDALRIIKTGDSNGKLSVGGVATFNDAVFADSTMEVSGSLSVGGEQGNKFNGPLNAANDVILGKEPQNTLVVKGLTTFSNNVTVDQGKNLYAETILASALGHYTDFNGGGEGQAAGTLDMFYENVTIHGDLDIMGQINQSATNVTELFVEDKSIVLGASSSSEVMSNSDGTYSYEGSNYATAEQDMHESGITISGVPGMFSNASERETEKDNVLWEKSLMWNLPSSGNNSSGTSNLAMNSKRDDLKHLEPFWEFKGGQLRITATPPIPWTNMCPSRSGSTPLNSSNWLNSILHPVIMARLTMPLNSRRLRS